MAAGEQRHRPAAHQQPSSHSRTVVDEAAVMEHAPPPRRRTYRSAKRALDLAVAVPALVVMAPVIAVLMILVRIDSPGPALFVQPRVGYRGRLIRFYKLRTMYVDARERFPELYDYQFDPDELDQTYYKPEDDPRVTRMGRWLRRFSLDELPNLVNVVIGNVSLVGPRPELPDVVSSAYRPEQLAKFSVPSGVTGLAQTSGRNLLTVEAQIEADLEYVRTCSFWLDLRILLRTVRVLASRVGAT